MKILVMILKQDFIHEIMKLIDHCLQEKTKTVIGLMNDELGGKIITEFVALRPKTYSNLMDDGNSDKKAKATEKCVIKRLFKFNDHTTWLLDNEITLKSQQRFQRETHKVYIEEINKMAVSSNDNKKLQTFERITSYPYGTSAGKVCKTEIVSKYK